MIFLLLERFIAKDRGSTNARKANPGHRIIRGP